MEIVKGLSVKKCGEKFVATVLPSFLRLIFLEGESLPAFLPCASEHSVCSRWGPAPKNGRHPIQNVLTESKRIILREEHYHEEHEGHEVKSDY